MKEYRARPLPPTHSQSHQLKHWQLTIVERDTSENFPRFAFSSVSSFFWLLELWIVVFPFNLMQRIRLEARRVSRCTPLNQTLLLVAGHSCRNGRHRRLHHGQVGWLRVGPAGPHYHARLEPVGAVLLDDRAAPCVCARRNIAHIFGGTRSCRSVSVFNCIYVCIFFLNERVHNLSNLFGVNALRAVNEEKYCLESTSLHSRNNAN